MTLQELTEPLFAYVCRLNRSARKGLTVDHERTRGEIRMMLNDMRTKANETPGLSEQFEKTFLPLVFFVDFMIKESELPFAMSWELMAAEHNELAGDDKFFDMLDEELSDNRPGAAERLTIYYSAMGLGFTGWYKDNPEALRKKMLEVSSRIGQYMDSDPSSKICPSAYENVNQSDLIQPPGASLAGVGIAVAGLVLVLVIANIYLYYSSQTSLKEALNTITGQG